MGSAMGVAVGTSALAMAGAAHRLPGDLTAYHVAYLAVACCSIGAGALSLTVQDADAAETRVKRPRRRDSAASVRA